MSTIREDSTRHWIDGRTAEGRRARAIRCELLAQIGHTPTEIERAVLERIVALALRLPGCPPAQLPEIVAALNAARAALGLRDPLGAAPIAGAATEDARAA